MRYTIRQVPLEAWRETLRALHTLTLSGDDHPKYEDSTWFLAFPVGSCDPVAFAGVKSLDEKYAYLTRCGVLSGHRGAGLQRRLIQRRLAWARKQGHACSVTTTYENPSSANNLIRAGFRQYTPEGKWCADGTDYWWRSLTSP